MKNFAKLVLVFSTSFLALFLISTAFRFVALRVDWASNLPAKPETAITLMIAAAHWALSLSLFASLLFAAGYSIRRGYPAIMAMVILMSLAFVFCFLFSAILVNWKAVPPTQTDGIPLGDKGIILTSSETAIVLLNGTAEPLGPRVTSIPDQPLIYQESVGSAGRADGAVNLPPVPFGGETPWFLQSLAIDLRMNGDAIQKRFSEGFDSFLVYTGALIFLLCSLGLAIKFSAWPLANLFLGVLAFRGVLALEVFLSTAEMQELMGSFLKNALPVSLAIPAIFLATGALLQLYSMLIFITKRRYDYD